MSEEKVLELAQGISAEVVGDKYNTPGMADAIRRAGAEGIVLLRNDDDVLPVGDERLAMFGRCQVDTFYVGYGSGGDVKALHKVSVLDGLEAAGLRLDKELSCSYRDWCGANPVSAGEWGRWAYSYPEMPLNEEQIRRAAAENDKAIVVIGRAAGEDGDLSLKEGEYYLSQDERELLGQIDKNFEQVIVLLNIGNIIDLSWLSDYSHIKGAMIIWQLGQEMGHAVADVVTGRISPSGHLTQTIARRYEDYPSSAYFGDPDRNEYKEGLDVGYRGLYRTPERILYPFGYGLSYTTFEITGRGLSEAHGGFVMGAEIRNTGRRSGKGLAQVYLKKPNRSPELAAFAKSDELAPGESEYVELFIEKDQLDVFDPDSCSYIREKGDYGFFLGNSPIDLYSHQGSICIDRRQIVKKCETITESSDQLKQRIIDNMPDEIGTASDQRIDFSSVIKGEKRLCDFVAQLSPEELSDLSRGEGPMDSSLSVKGNTGVFGGITERLRSRGIPVVNTSDGPSGLRINYYCALLPIGTALAASYNPLLVEQMYEREADEMKHYGVDIFLGPGMNIQRNPLCGRNFEYYSEDPYLTGRIASAAVRGLERHGAAACIKHFACNDQETNRNRNDSCVDERTLREIYLKAFYMVIRDAHPKCIMTSYNKVNGVWSHYNYDLATTLLRREWGFKGLVITDWWMQMAESPEFPGVRDNAYRVRAGVNVLMPGGLGVDVASFIHDDNIERTLTLGELQKNAAEVLGFIRDLKRDQDYGSCL